MDTQASSANDVDTSQRPKGSSYMAVSAAGKNLSPLKRAKKGG
jgi:hypothetical protein